MALIQSGPIRARIIQTDEFMWQVSDFEAVRGRSSTHEITGEQGQPRIENPVITDITLRFWREQSLTTEITDTHTDWAVGDQNLGQIFTLTNFNVGTDDITVDIQTDTTGVTTDELEGHSLWNNTEDYLDVYLTLEITQPD